VQKCRNAGMQEAGKQECRNAGMLVVVACTLKFTSPENGLHCEIEQAANWKYLVKWPIG
jgi:hypothetical protein